MKSFPAEVLEDRAGEVVDHRIQHGVEIGHADGDVKCGGQVLHFWTDFRFVGVSDSELQWNVKLTEVDLVGVERRLK